MAEGHASGLPADTIEHLRHVRHSFRPQLAPNELSSLPVLACAQETLHWAAASGFLVGSDGQFAHAPCSLIPYPLPSSLFAQALSLATPFNTLVDRVSRDTAWLHAVTRSVTASDAFTARLLALSEAVCAEGIAQPLQLGINRSDYMLHQPTPDAAPCLKQVELNTIACSFVSLSAKICELHRELLLRYVHHPKAPHADALKRLAPIAAAITEPEARLPENSCVDDVAAAVALAHSEYTRLGLKAAPAAGPAAVPLVVLMVVQPGETNVTDQRGIEQRLWRPPHRVPLRRVTLGEVGRLGSVVGPQRRLRLGGMEASVVYFRAGYTPADYAGEDEWRGRELIERSLAIKCPSVAAQLAGTKKVQQVLAQRDELARFVSPDHAAMLRSCFVGLYGLDERGGDDVDDAVAQALGSPGEFVLKPQREGGGHNLFGDEVRQELERLTAAERSAYILMDRILPPTSPATLMRGGEVVAGDCICELGVFGVFLGDGRSTLLNASAGHLLRAKLASVDEGGVCAGFAVLSSPALYL